MFRILIALSLALFEYSVSLAQPSSGSGTQPCPPGTEPCNPAFNPYQYEDVINAEKFGITQMSNPFGIATGPDGRIYVVEYVSFRGRVFIYNPDGSLYRTIDTGLNYTSGQLLFSVAVDLIGNIFVGGQGQVKVFDINGNWIRSIDASGSASDQFTYAWDLEVDTAGNIYILDYPNKVVVYNKEGVHLYTIPEANATAIALDKDNTLWIAGYVSNKIMHYSGDQLMNVIESVIGPFSITFGEDDLMYVYHYTEDYNSFAFSTFYQGSLLIKTEFQEYANITAAETGSVYFADYSNSRLLKVNVFTGEYTVLVRNDLPGTLYYAGPIDVDQNGNVYVFDRLYQPRLQVFDYKGNFLAQYEDMIYPAKMDVDNGVVYAISGDSIVVYSNGVLINTLHVQAHDLAVYQSELYALDRTDALIKVFNTTGELQRTISYSGFEFEIGPLGEIYVPSGDSLLVLSNTGEFIKDLEIPVPSSDFRVDDKGYIYVNYACYIWVYSSDGVFLQQIGLGGCNYDQFYAERFSVANGRLYASAGWYNRIDVFSNLPAIQVADKQVNYKDIYHFLPEETENGNRISYKIKDGTAVSLSFNTMLDLNHAGEVILEASAGASATMRKSVDEFKVTVGKAVLHFTAQNNSRTYGDNNPEFSVQAPYYSALVSGLRGDDDLIEIDELPILTTEANILSPVGDYPISFTGGSDNNYEFEFTQGTLTVTKAILQLQVDEQERQYGDINPEFTFQAVGFKNDDSIEDLDDAPQLSSTASLTSPAGEYPITIVAGLDNNYSIQPVNGVLTVTKAQLLVKANDATRAYKEPNPTFSVTLEGFKNNDTQDILAGVPVPYSTAELTSPVGQYPILIPDNTDSRYTYVTEGATLTIVKANQQIVFDALPSPIGSDTDPFAVFAAATSELPVVFSIASGPATINGELLTLTGASGIVTVHAMQPGNENYNPAETVTRSFEVTLVTGYEDELTSLKIFPNPAREVLQMSSATGIRFQLLNTNGVPVAQHMNSFANEHVVETTALAEGIYLLMLQTSTGTKVTRKISVIK